MLPRRRADTTEMTDRLRLGTGVTEQERNTVISLLGPLWTRLRSFRDAAIDLELSVKGRTSTDPRTTLTCQIAGRTSLTATSTHTDLRQAIIAVRDNLVGQLDGPTAHRHDHRPRRP